jgi:hypothetical protein
MARRRAADRIDLQIGRRNSFGLGHLDQQLARAFGQRQRADVGAAQIREGLDRRLGDQIERRLAHDAGQDAQWAAVDGVDHGGIGTGDGKLRCAGQQTPRDLAAVGLDLERRLNIIVLEVAVVLGDPIRDGEDHDRWRDHGHRIGGAGNGWMREVHQRSECDQPEMSCRHGPLP